MVADTLEAMVGEGVGRPFVAAHEDEVSALLGRDRSE